MIAGSQSQWNPMKITVNVSKCSRNHDNPIEIRKNHHEIPAFFIFVLAL